MGLIFIKLLLKTRKNNLVLQFIMSTKNMTRRNYFQKIIDVDVKTPEELSEKILKLEHRYYEIIKKILSD